jgi:hypothetical protein
MSSKLIVYVDKNKEVEGVYEPFSTSFFVGYRKIDFEVGIPRMSFIGGKIQLSDWYSLIHFFKKEYAKSKSEAQAVFYLNKQTKRIVPWVRPQQQGTGMTTRELGDHKNRAEDDLLFPSSEYVIIGTVHHHCSSSAFQSSTDRHNEENQTGLHITLGHIDQDVLDFHGRMTYVTPGDVEKGTKAVCQFFNVCLSDWFEMPEELSCFDLSADTKDAILSDLLFRVPKNIEDFAFPDRWMENMIEVSRFVPEQKYNRFGGYVRRDDPYSYGGWGYPGGVGFQGGGTASGRNGSLASIEAHISSFKAKLSSLERVNLHKDFDAICVETAVSPSRLLAIWVSRSGGSIQGKKAEEDLLSTMSGYGLCWAEFTAELSRYVDIVQEQSTTDQHTGSGETLIGGREPKKEAEKLVELYNPG